MRKRIFVTATNTDIGKTYTTLKLLENYASKGISVGVIKLIETGVVDGVYPDGDILLSALKKLNPACSDFSVNDVVPISYELPAAPFIASQGKALDFGVLNDAIDKMEAVCDILIIEGAGGLLVPVDGNFMMIDLIPFFNAVGLLVTHCALGCINDSMLSLGALQSRNIDAMMVFNQRTEDGDFSTISQPYFVSKDIEILKVDEDIDTICDVLYNL
ncbi:dethiobiotin synthase [Sulfurimonas sp. SAG-AH-194-C21]|nr:dethiobiotin synthase [Sulfurimonas sp. SAG-AH-194-C21]MDF1882870.1 dethiobiotin synthase [Sulfurimonas sp. SAG-AH-194-C21]